MKKDAKKAGAKPVPKKSAKPLGDESTHLKSLSAQLMRTKPASPLPPELEWNFPEFEAGAAHLCFTYEFARQTNAFREVVRREWEKLETTTTAAGRPKFIFIPVFLPVTGLPNKKTKQAKFIVHLFPAPPDFALRPFLSFQQELKTGDVKNVLSIHAPLVFTSNCPVDNFNSHILPDSDLSITPDFKVNLAFSVTVATDQFRLWFKREQQKLEAKYKSEKKPFPKIEARGRGVDFLAKHLPGLAAIHLTTDVGRTTCPADNFISRIRPASDLLITPDFKVNLTFSPDAAANQFRVWYTREQENLQAIYKSKRKRFPNIETRGKGDKSFIRLLRGLAAIRLTTDMNRTIPEAIKALPANKQYYISDHENEWSRVRSEAEKMLQSFSHAGRSALRADDLHEFYVPLSNTMTP